MADDIRDEAISRILNDEKVNLVFAALLSACLWNLITWWFGLPVSTTHIITGGIVGAGMFKRFSAVHWGVARRIVWAWVITMPAAGAIAALSYFLKTL